MNAHNQIQEIVKQYAQSVNELDLTKAKSLWLDATGVSFIHPRGHENGLEQIIHSFYQKTMGRFSKRELTPYDVNVTIIGDTALVVFYWKFNAIFANDNSPLQTEGRETQVMTRTSEGWKLLHIHYSGLPVNGEREGF